MDPSIPQRLAAPSTPIEEKSKLVGDLRDSIEVVLTSEYPNFLQAFFKPFCDILRTVPAQTSDTAEHKLRNSILDILNRLPQNDFFKPYVQEMLDVCTSTLQDNQDNAVIAIKMVFDLQKTYKPQLEAQAGQFLEFVCQVRGVWVVICVMRMHMYMRQEKKWMRPAYAS